MVESFLNCNDPAKADVILLAANYDQTSSFGKGADKGPQAIKNCLDLQLKFYDPYTRTSPSKTHRIAYHDLGDLNSFPPEEMVKRVTEEFEKYSKSFIS